MSVKFYFFMRFFILVFGVQIGLAIPVQANLLKKCFLIPLKVAFSSNSAEGMLGRVVSKEQKAAIMAADLDISFGKLMEKDAGLFSSSELAEIVNDIENAQIKILRDARFSEQEIYRLRKMNPRGWSLVRRYDETTLKELFSFPENAKVPRLNEKTLTLRNEEIVKQLESMSMHEVQTTDMKTIHEIYETIDHHPVASLSQLPKYDRHKTLGLCYGRASAVQLEAKVRGLNENSIRKIWVAGDFKQHGNVLGWHVASMVRSNEGVWYAIDTTMGRPLTAREWVDGWKALSTEGSKMVVYTTDANQVVFGWKMNHPYSIERTRDDFGWQMRAFYDDLYRSYRELDLKP